LEYWKYLYDLKDAEDAKDAKENIILLYLLTLLTPLHLSVFSKHLKGHIVEEKPCFC